MMDTISAGGIAGLSAGPSALPQGAKSAAAHTAAICAAGRPNALLRLPRVNTNQIPECA